MNTRSLNSNDQDLVEFWAGATEILLTDNAPIQSTLFGIIEFFAAYIPQEIHMWVTMALSNEMRLKLFGLIYAIT